jgi:hypothetical protein
MKTLVNSMLLAAVCGLPLTAADDDLTLQFAQATRVEDRWTVTLRATKDLTPADQTNAQTKARYEILNLDTGTVAADVDAAHLREGLTLTAGPRARFIRIGLPGGALNAANRYMMAVTGLQYQGKPLKPISLVVTFPGQPTAPEQPATNTSQFPLTFSKAAKQDDADFYISGEVDTVSKTKSPDDHKIDGIADIEIGYKFYQNIGNQTQVFKPEFSFKASSVKGHDPNAMSLGLRWDTPVTSWLRWRKEPKLESTKNFTVADGVFATSLRFLPRDLHGIYFTPNIGIETGGVWKAPLPDAKGSAIFRGIFGSELDYNHDFKLGGLKGIGFSAAYVRRVLARREVAIDDSDPNALKPLPFGRSPHDHVQAKLKIMNTDLLGFTIAYEYGDLPPAYNRVYNQVKIGLLFQAAVKAR